MLAANEPMTLERLIPAAVLATLTPTDALHLMAGLAERIPHGIDAGGRIGVVLNLGRSDDAYALVAEIPGSHPMRAERRALARIGCLVVLAEGLPKVAGPNDSQMVRPDGPDSAEVQR